MNLHCTRKGCDESTEITMVRANQGAVVNLTPAIIEALRQWAIAQYPSFAEADALGIAARYFYEMSLSLHWSVI
jgi:hypothetical protein